MDRSYAIARQTGFAIRSHASLVDWPLIYLASDRKTGRLCTGAPHCITRAPSTNHCFPHQSSVYLADQSAYPDDNLNIGNPGKKMSFNEKDRKKWVEEPQLEHLSEETLKNPPKQRTVQQQQKQDKLIKQERREQGIDTARSRSSSRRDRRKRIKQAMEDGTYMKTASLEALEEADANHDLAAMRPFERIGPDSTSMDGPVTMARAKRGEIPIRGSNPNQPYYLPPEQQEGVSCDGRCRRQ